MAARERWLRGVGAQLDLRRAFFGGGSSGVAVPKRPDAEKEDVSAPNIVVVITVQLGFGTCDRRTSKVIKVLCAHT